MKKNKIERSLNFGTRVEPGSYMKKKDTWHEGASTNIGEMMTGADTPKQTSNQCRMLLTLHASNLKYTPGARHAAVMRLARRNISALYTPERGRCRHSMALLVGVGRQLYLTHSSTHTFSGFFSSEPFHPQDQRSTLSVSCTKCGLNW